MGAVDIYLIPETDIEDPRRARADIVRLLQAEGIIGGQRDYFYPVSERSECYVVGGNNLAVFDLDPRDGDVAFQACQIYGHPEPAVVPAVMGHLLLPRQNRRVQ